MSRESHYRWSWTFQSRPEDLWPLVADTNRFNRDAGLPAVERVEATSSSGRRLRTRVLGLPIEWEEAPFEWVRPRRFGVIRRYSSGPVTELRELVTLDESRDGGTDLTFQLWIRPRGALGRAAVSIQVGVLARKRFEETFRRYDALAALRGGSLEDAQQPSVRLAPRGRERARRIRSKLLEVPGIGGRAGAEAVDRLVSLVEHEDDFALARIRPYALADAWRAPRRDVLELCLHATRAGLLELRWDILCPGCRGAVSSSPALAEVSSKAHCDYCRIEYTVNFDRLVELTFRPSPAVRRVEAALYCTGGPQATPHVVLQQVLAPGEERIVRPRLEEGRYRARGPNLAGLRLLAAVPGGQAWADLQADGAGWPGDELRIALEPEIRFRNATADEQLLLLERTAWSDTAATAAEVTSLGTFRDLFANEALRPGEQLSVGKLAILFTDLRESTRLYRQVGDAKAFGWVMDHFDVLRKAVSAEGGAVVKTLGDAILAVFARPAAAVRAALEAQELLARPRGEARPFYLKAAIHHGPCLAVTQNERLDYFGSTVNVAARLVSLSSGADLVISSDVHEDPEVADLLARSPDVRAEHVEAMLRGFDAERFDLWKLSRGRSAIE